MSAEHTPGPWRVDINNECRIAAHDGIGIATTSNVSPRREDYNENVANAAFIVRACNSHDELLSALQTLERAIANNEPFSRAEHEQARAAIQKATT